MKIRKTIPSIFLVNIELPRSWEEMTQPQLRYLLLLQVQQIPMERAKIMLLLRMAGVQPIQRMEGGNWLVWSGRKKVMLPVFAIASALTVLDWMDEPPRVPVALDALGKARRIDLQLHGLPFGQYLILDNLYQGFIQSHEMSDLLQMAQILYPGCRKNLTEVEQLGVLQWFTTLKLFFANKWSDLFTPSAGESSTTQESLMNAMIRALSGGDILKEREILETVDVWRALTELDAKARESNEIKNKS